MAKRNTFTDVFKADSERDAIAQLYRSYPDAEEFTLKSRETASGTKSASGHFFHFQITLQPQDFSHEFDRDDDTGDINLEKDEY